MKSFLQKPALRVSALIMAVFIVAVGILSRPFAMNRVYALTESLGFSIPGLGESMGPYEILPGVTWWDVDEILMEGGNYDYELVEWAMTHYREFENLLQYAVSILVQYPTPQEANAFLDMLLMLRNYEEPGEEFPEASAGIRQAANGLESYLASQAVNSDGGEAVESFARQVKETGQFRHYQVELEFQPQLIDSEFGRAMDMVLLVDVSESMGGEKLESVKSVLNSFVREALKSRSNVRVGLVAYGAESEIHSDLVGPEGYDDLIRFITSLSAGGATAAQWGIVDAKRVLGVADGETLADGGRDKVIVHFSDGGAVLPYSDFWTYGYNMDESEHPTPYNKRWSFSLGTSGGYAVPGISTREWGESSSHQVMAKRLAALELQYAVSQGIDVYAVDYSPDGSDPYLELSTYPMANPPGSFAYKGQPSAVRSVNPLEQASYSTQGYTGRVYNGAREAQLLQAYDDLFNRSAEELPEFTIKDYINTELFEMVGSPVLSQEGSYDGTVEYDGDSGVITWISGGGDAHSTRKLTYTIRVVDKPVLEEGAGDYGPEGAARVETGEASLLTYGFGGSTVSVEPDYTQPVSIPPLLSGTAQAVNLDGTPVGSHAEGGAVFLEGLIAGGSGSFRYQWLLDDQELQEEAAAEADDEGTVELESLQVPVLEEGEHSFLLQITDEGARQAGYEAEGVADTTIPLAVRVEYGTVTVEIQGSEGAFEIRTTVDNGVEEQKWYSVGAGTRTYRVPVGSTVTVEAYAPPGYKVSGSGSSVTVRSPGDSAGETIRITIAEDSVSYYVDWAWPTQ